MAKRLRSKLESCYIRVKRYNLRVVADEKKKDRVHKRHLRAHSSLRASGVTPASCCWNTQLVFWPRMMRELEKSQDRM